MSHIRLMVLGLACSATFPLLAMAADAGGPTAPIANITTPELALKSYWALREWSESDNPDLTKAKERNRRYLELMTQITSGETQEFFRTVGQAVKISVERRILSVMEETPTRAIVVTNAKNVSPIPKEAKLTPALIELRKKGRDFKYVMVRETNGWKISEVWVLNEGASRRILEPPLTYFPAIPPLD